MIYLGCVKVFQRTTSQSLALMSFSFLIPIHLSVLSLYCSRFCSNTMLKETDQSEETAEQSWCKRTGLAHILASSYILLLLDTNYCKVELSYCMWDKISSFLPQLFPFLPWCAWVLCHICACKHSAWISPCRISCGNVLAKLFSLVEVQKNHLLLAILVMI